MAENQIAIKKIRLKDLAGWAAENLNRPAYRKVPPITLKRAVSQSKNPYGRPEDVVLLLAMRGDQCIGYHGLLPALFKQGDRFSAVHWATTFFVDPDFRGQGVAKCLLQEIKNSEIEFAVCQITEGARRAYRSMGFEDLGALGYFQLRVDRLDFVARLFDAAARRFKKKGARQQIPRPGFIRLLQRPVYRLTKRLFYRRVAQRSARRPMRQFSCRTVDRIDESVFGESERQSAGVSFFRGTEAVNWMLEHPWVVSGNPRKAGTTGYYFSDVRDIFRYVAIEIDSAQKGGPAGFLVLSVSRKKGKTRVKILDFYFKNPADEEIAVYLALKHAGACFADRIEYPCSLSKYFNQRAEFKALIKKQSRSYMFYPDSSRSPLSVCRGKIALGYCDGDTALT